ncbi:MAG: DNA polymerase/3'-5' exonuclease PolX [Firmicutes bacterium]|nr:DNA polymerase/3'-5' exonuclease PolX [Bacillota bacterium]
MTNSDISALLEKIATAMAIKGMNQFKIRAFENGARIAADYEGSLEESALQGTLTSIDGIGKGIAEVISDYVSTGKSDELEEIMGDMPQSIFEIVEIPGIGPKKAGLIYQNLGASSLEDLERAARTNAIAELKGFGKKTQDTIIKGIELKKKYLGSRSIAYTLELWELIRAELLNGSPHMILSETGELRRRTETAGSLDILFSSPEPEKTFKTFAGLSCFESVSEKNEQKISARTTENFAVNLIKSEPSLFSLNLMLTTGSEAHTGKLLSALKEKGYNLNDRNFLTDSEDMVMEIPDEQTIYNLAGLPFIPPELRETGEEIETLKGKPSPIPVDLSDIKGDMQMHSQWSDGSATIEQMAEKAISLGYSYIALTDHTKSLYVAHGLDSDRLHSQQAQIDELNQKYAGKFRIFKSAEVDILADGSLDYDEETLKTLDFVLISIHSSMKMAKDKMTERIIKAVSHPLVHCLAHPTGRLIGRREEFSADWDAIFEAVKANGKALEINAHPSRLDLKWEMCRKALSMKIPIIINTDAHSPDGMEVMKYGVMTARKGWMTKEEIKKGLLINALETNELEQWLKKG